MGNRQGMSTVIEIETAITRLPAQKVEEIAAWLDEYRDSVHAADVIFSMYDEEEKVS
jgi:hypothetical protein